MFTTGSKMFLGATMLAVVGAIVFAASEGGADGLMGRKVCALVAGGGYAQYCVAPAGTCLIVATFAIVAWSTFVAVSNESLNTVLVYIRQTMYAIGHLGLLAGFVLGLPSLERVVWADEDRGGRHDDAEATA